MKVRLTFDIELPDDFEPPEEFDGSNYPYKDGICEECPFYQCDSYEPIDGCGLRVPLQKRDGDNKCPLREFFKK